MTASDRIAEAIHATKLWSAPTVPAPWVADWHAHLDPAVAAEEARGGPAARRAAKEQQLIALRQIGETLRSPMVAATHTLAQRKPALEAVAQLEIEVTR